MKQKPLILLSILLLSLLALKESAFADTHNKAENHPLTHLEKNQALLHISATKNKEVEQDVLIASLRYEATNLDVKELQNTINATMQKAIKELKTDDALEISNGQYYVNKQQNKLSREITWTAQQTINLKSKKSESVQQAAGKLQNMGFVMNNLSYQLSIEKAQETQDKLMEDALSSLQKKALRAAKALGKNEAQLKEITVQNQGGAYPMHREHFARGMVSMAADSAAAPIANPGKTNISLTVSAKAILKP